MYRFMHVYLYMHNIYIYEREPKVKFPKRQSQHGPTAAVPKAVRSGSRGREAPAAREASHAGEARNARNEATRFVTADCT